MIEPKVPKPEPTGCPVFMQTAEGIKVLAQVSKLNLLI